MLYQVAYEGQILTEPLDFETAAHIAACENTEAIMDGAAPLAEVVLAPTEKTD